MKRLLVFFFCTTLLLQSHAQEDTLLLANKHVRISWLHTAEGWKINRVQLYTNNGWQSAGQASGEYTLLYAGTKPADSTGEVFKTITNTVFPDPVYKYQVNQWKESVTPVSLNTAGEALHFFPAEARKTGDKTILFTQHTKAATITAEWTLDEQYPGDVLVKQHLVAKLPGWYSLASPSLVTVPKEEMAWVTVPGYFQGNETTHNMVLDYGYGQGVPEKPVVYRERCASSLCPVVSNRQGISVAVIPDPGLARDPWAYDHITHQDWFLGLSHRNRKAQLSPTLYYPVLGEPHSQLESGKTTGYGFRYSLVKGEWYQLLSHAVNDIYHFSAALALRKNKQSLVNRMAAMRHYLRDRKTSLWNVETYNSLAIGGQSYLGGVVGSNQDAIKNADYGAMWMLAQTSNDRFLKDSVLPYALNFKLAQQQTEDGFFKGAAMGQYYLSKSKKFVEEWGEFVEPISLTYYIMLDVGNVLLFEPGNETLKERLALGASLLLRWQKPDGSWELAYDRHTHQPLFTDLKDLRPTFYGLLVAYRILKDGQYLAAAKKGADWLIKNAVEKGHFTGVCGDARYAPDFATAQSAQALLDLYDITKEEKYKAAAIRTARFYLTSVYTQPVASEKIKKVKGVDRADWQITQAGLSFEHGGILGSANSAGPIMLCSHAGMFIRMFQFTGDSLFATMARYAAIGRDAFVDSATSVASYYWSTMNKGAGPYPHHAWWQIGWITDYLMAEAQLRSAGNIVFPRGFVTPKVGPHESYGFAAGRIYGEPASLVMREGLVQCNDADVEYITAYSTDHKKLFVMVMNDTGESINTSISLDLQKLDDTKSFGDNYTITELTEGKRITATTSWPVDLKGYGIRVYGIEKK